MIRIRHAGERGRTKVDWLDSRHTFSFADYYDQRFMGFRALRVLNDDRVAPARGFGEHSHRDMEIVSYVLEGELEHKDDIGNGSIIRPGEVQRMSAGTGVEHSERNPSLKAPVHFLQIWIQPERLGIPPGYEQKAFPLAERRGRWRLVASKDGRQGSVTIHQDVSLYLATLSSGEEARHALREERYAWLHVAKGEVTCAGETLSEGDGLSLSDETEVVVSSKTPDAEVLLLDLA